VLLWPNPLRPNNYLKIWHLTTIIGEVKRASLKGEKGMKSMPLQCLQVISMHSSKKQIDFNLLLHMVVAFMGHSEKKVFMKCGT